MQWAYDTRAVAITISSDDLKEQVLMMNAQLPLMSDTLRSLIGDAQVVPDDEGESGAQVFRLLDDVSARYLKISQRDAKFPVRRDMERLKWLSGRVPVPEVLHYEEDAASQYLLMDEVPGIFPLHDDLEWSAEERIIFLADAAQRFHSLPVDECPFSWRLEQQIADAYDNVVQGRVRTDLLGPKSQSVPLETLYQRLVSLKPGAEDLVVVHGDLFPLNLRADRHTHELLGYIDVGATAVADRYIDLAVLAMAVTWHLGEDWIPRLFEAYGIRDIDWDKLSFYQLLNEFF